MKSVVRILQIVITATLIIAVFAEIDLSDSLEAIRGARVEYLLGTLALMTCSRIIMPLKWNLLLATHGIDLPRSRVIALYYVSCFVGQILPSTVGSDSVRLFLCSRNKAPVKDVLSSIIVERYFGALGLLSLALVGASILTLSGVFHFAGLNVPLVLLGLGGLFMASLLLLLREDVSRGVFFVLERLAIGRLTGIVSKALQGLYTALLGYRRDKRSLQIFYLVTVFESLVAFCAVWTVLLAFDLNVPVGYLFSFLPIQFFLIRIPISVAGWGVHEAGFAYYLSFAGVPAAVGLIVGLTHHLLYLLSFSPGAFFMARYQIKNEILSKFVKNKSGELE